MSYGSFKLYSPLRFCFTSINKIFFGLIMCALEGKLNMTSRVRVRRHFSAIQQTLLVQLGRNSETCGGGDGGIIIPMSGYCVHHLRTHLETRSKVIVDPSLVHASHVSFNKRIISISRSRYSCVS